MNIRSLFVGIATFALTLTWATPTVIAATETFHETYNIEADTPLTVKNRNGSITIEVWEKEEIDIVANKRSRIGGRLQDVDIRVNIGDTLNVETMYLVKNPRVSVEYIISVPASVRVVQAESSNGSITLKGTSGDAEVRTSNGSIKILRHNGDVNAKTSNGSIETRQISGIVKTRTSNGSITISEVAVLEEAETSNGSISAKVAEIPSDGLTLKTSNGKIRAWLSAGLNADLSMKTSNGKIAINDLEIVTTSVSKTALKGHMGSGGKPLTLKTSNGSIEVYGLK